LLDCEVDGKTITHRLSDALYAPSCPHNLISISRLDDAGLEAAFGNGKVSFVRKKDNRVMATVVKSGRLYRMVAKARTVQVDEHEGANAAEEASGNTWDAWH
ncbi:hypothetical protein C8F01DRAFT_927554, partial [Mycena amicta]